MKTVLKWLSVFSVYLSAHTTLFMPLFIWFLFFCDYKVILVALVLSLSITVSLVALMTQGFVLDCLIINK